MGADQCCLSRSTVPYRPSEKQNAPPVGVPVAKARTFTSSTTALLHRARHSKGKGLASLARVHRYRFEDDYTVNRNKKLGEGQSGGVYLAVGKVGGRQVAVKSTKLRGVSQSDLEDVLAELEIFLLVDHPHIIRLVDIYIKDELTFAMECMHGGTLQSRAELAKPCFPEDVAAPASLQMLLALHYLHIRKIVHRDLKLENYLYERDDSDHLKLADFGFSRINKTDAMFDEQVGTPMFLAPEVLNGIYSSSCDYWSYGVCVFVLLFGYLPFNDPDEDGPVVVNARLLPKYKNTRDFLEKTWERIEGCKYRVREDRWNNVSETAQDFVRRLLVVDPETRCTGAGAMAHAWQVQARQRRTGRIPAGVITAAIEALLSFAEASPLERASLTVASLALMRRDDDAQVRAVFLSLDRDQSGFLCLADLRAALEPLGREDKVEKILDALDASGDGLVGYSEFLAAMLTSKAFFKEDKSKLCGQAFQAFHKEPMDQLSAAEITEMIGSGEAEDLGREFLTEAGVDGSGSLSFTDFQRVVVAQVAGYDIPSSPSRATRLSATGRLAE